MPWKWIEPRRGEYQRVFVDKRGVIREDAKESTRKISDSWGEYETPVTVDSRNFILEDGPPSK